jgi:hypothetical protein
VLDQASVKSRWIGVFTLACLAASGCLDAPTAADTTPPGPLAALAAEVMGATVRLSWSEPGDPDVIGSLIARFLATGVIPVPEAGRTYGAGDALGPGVVVFSGRDTRTIDTSPPCQRQMYVGWARDGSGNWSQSQSVQVSGLPGSALPAAPTSLSARVDGTGIALAWTTTGSPPALVRVVRRRGAPPASAADGETVLIGPGTMTAGRDPMVELSPLLTWHYAVFACNPCADCEPAGARATVTPTLAQSLRAGGFVVFWRHTQANVCEDLLEPASNTTVPNWWKSCERTCRPAGTATARQLSTLGYAQADSIGSALKAKDIPFSRVLSSEYCRAIETAARMNLGPLTETLTTLTFFVYPTDPCTTLPELLAQVPRSGNTAIIAHLFLPCLDMTPQLAMGEALVYKPDGRGGSTLVQRVNVSEWATLP